MARRLFHAPLVEPLSSAPLLYRYVEEGRYACVVERCRTHPHEAAYVNKNEHEVKDLAGYTALHHACLHGAPPRAVVALLHAYPEAAKIENHFGDTPLNHSVCRESDVEVVRALLTVNKEMLRSKSKKSSLLLDFCMFHESMIEKLVQNTASTVKFASDEDERMFSKFNLLVQAMHHNSVDYCLLDGKRWRLLHACLAMPSCPLPLLRLALVLHPGQMKERDENGNMPLHIAVANPFIDKDEACIFQELIKASPDSVRVADRNGQLPLILAIEHQQDWESCIRPILDAAPVALTTRDIRRNLYPFMLAGKRDLPASVAYELLRQCPELERFSNPVISAVGSKRRSCGVADKLSTKRIRTTDWIISATSMRPAKTKKRNTI